MAAVLTTGSLAAQSSPRISVGVVPETVTVGDRFRSVVRISAPAGFRVVFPPAPDSSAALQPVDSARIIAAQGEWTAVYPLVGWSTALPSEPPRLAVRMIRPDGAAEIVRVALPLPSVRSVLPPDSAEVEPKPARDVVDLPRGFPWLALIAALIAALGALLWWWKGRMGVRPLPLAAPPPSAPPDPRADALATLDRLRSAGLLERREWKEFHSRLAGVLRGYLAILSPRWSDDLTTWELIAMLREEGIEPGQVEELYEILSDADLVKFARREPTAADAERSWTAAREWVAAFAPAAPSSAAPMAGMRP